MNIQDFTKQVKQFTKLWLLDYGLSFETEIQEDMFASTDDYNAVITIKTGEGNSYEVKIIAHPEYDGIAIEDGEEYLEADGGGLYSYLFLAADGRIKKYP